MIEKIMGYYRGNIKDDGSHHQLAVGIGKDSQGGHGLFFEVVPGKTVYLIRKHDVTRDEAVELADKFLEFTAVLDRINAR